MTKEKGFIINHKEITIRGSFINMLFTIVLMVLFVAAAIYKEVAENLKMVAELIIAIYAISYGVWQGKKYLENKNNKKEEPE